MVSVPRSAPSAQARAAIYTRVSTLEQGERGYSLDAQAQDCERLAGELATAVVATFRDRDSGAAWDLPGLNAMLDAAKRREFDLLLVYDPDRLARRMAKQLVIEEELQRAGVTIRYVTLRAGDSAEDRLLKNVRSSIAEYEREKIALRTSRGRRAKAERGLIVGTGRAPYGYRYTRDAAGRVMGLEPDPATAPIVQRIFAAVVTTPLNVLCARLNHEGIPTYFGARGWANSTLLGILNNPAYLGTAAYGRRDTHKQWRDQSLWLTCPVPPLVDRAIWDAAHAALARRKVERSARRPDADDAYVLRGLLTCAHCGGALASTYNNGCRYYACLRNQPYRARLHGESHCSLPAALAGPLEERAWMQVSAALLDPDHLLNGLASAQQQHADADQRRRDRLETLDREIARLRARFDRITDERLDAQPGSETERALKTKAEDTETAIRRLLSDRAELDAQPAPGLTEQEGLELARFAEEVRAGLDHATGAERRRVYDLLRLRGKVRLDPDHGVKLGRRHRFAVDWDAVIELQHSGKNYKKTRVEYFTDDYADWERRFLGEVKISLEGIPASEPVTVASR
jgi:site-specific DNA recombinase